MAIQTITIAAGESAFLPRGAKIIAKTATGGIDISSVCVDTEVVPKSCYELIFNLSEVDGATGALEGAGPKVVGMFIGGTLTSTNINLNDEAGITTALGTISGGAISDVVVTVTDLDASAMESNRYAFKAPDSIGDNMYLVIQESAANGIVPTPYRFYPVKVVCGGIS